jgi:Cytochrome c oxidase assembly protein COX16
MPAFASRPLNGSPIHRQLKKHPALFGIPFLFVMVGASFGLQAFTQTRYDLHNQKVTQVRPPLFFSFSPRFLNSRTLFSPPGRASITR